MVFDNVEGLSDNSVIHSKGLVIGNIEDMKLFKDKVLVEVNIKEEFKVPIDTKISIDVEGILVSKFIKFDMGQSTSVYKDKDTVTYTILNQPIDNLQEKLILLTDSIRKINYNK